MFKKFAFLSFLALPILAFSGGTSNAQPVNIKEINTVSFITIHNRTGKEIEVKVGDHITSTLAPRSKEGMAILTKSGINDIVSGDAKCDMNVQKQNGHFDIQIFEKTCSVTAK